MNRCRRSFRAAALLVTVPSVILAGSPADAPEARPDLTFGMFLGAVEEGARVFGPIELLPFEHPAAQGHEFPNPPRFHQAQVEVLVHLGLQAGLGLRATLDRYPDPPTDTWPYPGFRLPAVDEIRSASVRRVDGAPPLPGLRVVVCRDREPLAFVLDTRGMTLTERGMKAATTMGLDMSRVEFLDRLRSSLKHAPAEGTWILVFTSSTPNPCRAAAPAME